LYAILPSTELRYLSPSRPSPWIEARRQGVHVCVRHCAGWLASCGRRQLLPAASGAAGLASTAQPISRRLAQGRSQLETTSEWSDSEVSARCVACRQERRTCWVQCIELQRDRFRLAVYLARLQQQQPRRHHRSTLVCRRTSSATSNYRFSLVSV